MNKFLAVLTLCGAPLLVSAEPLPSLEAFLQQARVQPAPVALTAVPVPAPTVHLRHTSISNMGTAAGFLNKDYQLGDEWGKKPVTAGSLGKESSVFQRAAKATANYGGGTAFYLGIFNGHHMMATNHHVMRAMGCGVRADFVLLGKSFPCEKVYGDWTESDLAVFAIRGGAADAAVLAGLGRNFAYDAEIYPGQELLTIGFGVANNPRGVMMANQDSDCRVFSKRNEFRKMADPDDFNPGPDKVWSFASGCEVSHGDSGSAFVERNTGDVVGIVWTGRIPKSPKVSSSAYLTEMQRLNSPEIWTELSYTVPAASIRDGLNAALAGPLSPDERATIGAIVGSAGVTVVAH